MHAAIEADEILESESEQQVSARMQVIEAYALIMKEKRKAAIDARRASGIEAIWLEDEDAYEGVDQYNRKNQGYTKGRTVDAGLIDEKKAPTGRSTALPNITRPYCDAAAARVADMLLPTDDRNWAIRPTPDPKLIKHLNDMTPAIGPDGVPMTKQVPAQAAPAVQQQNPGILSRIGGAVAGMFNPAPEQAQATQSVTVGEVAQQEIDKAKKSAERAQTVIDDYLVECRYHAEVRKVIESTTRIGVGILKGPHPTKKKARTAKKSPDGWTVQMEVKTAPVSLSVDPWNFYPDPNCGDDIQNGSHCFERDDITRRGLNELKGAGYINEMIDLCLEEGPISAVDLNKKTDGSKSASDKDLFEIWYGHISVSKKDMEAAGCECDKDYAPAVVTMVNERIIKITLSPLDSGEFPYDVMVWQTKIGSWAGLGVGRHIRTCQQGLTGAVRSLMDNNAISSGPQFIIDTSKIEPQNGKWSISPNKIWRKKNGVEDITDVRTAMVIVSIETRQVEILNIINYWTKEAENVTGLPMLLQGQQGGAPNTLGATQIVNNNSSTVLRRIARTFDDRITERHIGRYYEWVLLHGPDDAKGDFQIDARGSSALVERDMQNQAMMQLLGVSLNPAYGLDPDKVAKEVLKGMRLDHKSFAFDEEQKKAMAEKPAPEDPRITAAKIMMEGKLKSEEMESRQLADRTVAEARMELQRQNHEAGQNAEDRKDTADELKVKLADTAMKLKMQEKLTMAAQAQADDHVVAQHRMDLHNSKQVATPAVEPIGKAPAGEAYIK